MAGECLRIDIPYPVHTLVMFPCPEQAAGTAVVSVEALPGLAVC
jgi:hypothetical protein